MFAVAEYAFSAVDRKQKKVSPARTLRVNVNNAFPLVKNVCIFSQFGWLLKQILYGKTLWIYRNTSVQPVVEEKRQKAESEQLTNARLSSII
jgi:hypothetical protein